VATERLVAESRVAEAQPYTSGLTFGGLGEELGEVHEIS